MLNSVCLQGRLTNNPECRESSNKNIYVQFILAVDRNVIKSDGQRQTDFIKCVAFAQTANFIARNFKKGQQMLISGRISTSTYADDSGMNRTDYSVVIGDVHFVGYRNPKHEKEADFEEQNGDVPF